MLPVRKGGSAQIPGSVSVVIPTHNARSTVRKTVEACLGQSYPGVEIVVVDDGSTDDTFQVLRPLLREGNVRYLRQENRGPSAARNRGWREAEGRFICFTDSDCVPRSDWVEKLIGALQREGKAAAAGGGYDILNPESLLALLVWREILWRHKRMPSRPRALGSYNLCVRREVLEEIGGFDEEYREPSGEDTDLSYRIRQRGYHLLWVEEAKVAHRFPERLLFYLRQQYRHGFWRVRLYRSHPFMVKGDDYTYWKDAAEVMLLLALCCTSFLFAVGLSPWKLSLFFLLAYLGVQIPSSLSVCLEEKSLRYLPLAALTALRGGARTGGFLRGIFSR